MDESDSDGEILQVYRPLDEITSEEFEIAVKGWFEKTGRDIESFEAAHLEVLPGMDGDYTFDVTIRFKLFEGAEFLVLVECKKHKNPIKREVVQVLRDRLQSVGAHKGFVIATAPFQRGALEYAEKHGIALIQVQSGRINYIRATAAKELPPLPPGVPRFVGCHFVQGTQSIDIQTISEKDGKVLESLLGFPTIPSS